MDLLTDKQLANRWQCSEKKLANDRVKGVGPRFIKLGDGKNSPIRYPLESVEQFEAERTRTSTAA